MNMIPYVIANPLTGEIERLGWCQEEDLQWQGDGSAIPVLADPSTHYVLDGEAVEYTLEQAAAKAAVPAYPAAWSNETFEWVSTISLADLKSEKRAEINAARTEANIGNSAVFYFEGHPISCDPVSRSDLDGLQNHVSRHGTLPSWFPGAWKTDDNQYLPVPDVETWDALFGAMLQQGTLNFMHSEGLKQLLALATTPEEVDAIHWGMELPA